MRYNVLPLTIHVTRIRILSHNAPSVRKLTPSNVSHVAQCRKMPKTGRGKARKETGRSQYRATAPVCTAVEMEEEEEGESGEDGSGEAKEEQLEGLERNDMMLISRMEL